MAARAVMKDPSHYRLTKPEAAAFGMRWPVCTDADEGRLGRSCPPCRLSRASDAEMLIISIPKLSHLCGRHPEREQ